MMIFSRPPRKVYLTNEAGDIIKAVVLNASYSMSIGNEATMTIECQPTKFVKRQELADIDPAVFEALLEDEYGRCTKVPEEVAEETAKEVEP